MQKVRKVRNKKNNRNVLISSIVPILLLIFIGGAITNNLKKQQTDKSNINSINENKIVNETATNNQNIKKENNNEIITNGEKNTIEESGENKKEDENSQTNVSNSSKKKIVFDETVAFIGDSRTQGLIMYTGLSRVQDYSYIGLMVDTAITKEFVKIGNGQKVTLLEDMKNKNIKKVYIMLGVNELGWSYPSVFKIKYEELIDEIRKVKPNCDIYIQSIIPVTKSKDKSDKIYNNANIKKFNALIKEVANEKNVKYLDVQSSLIDSEGYLPENASTDGIHVGQDYCEKWLEFLKNNS